MFVKACQNYFFRSPLVLSSAVLRIRLIIFLLWIQGETTHFLQTVFYYSSLGQALLLPLKRKMACDSSYPWISDFSPQTFPQVLTVICKSTAEILNVFLRLGPAAVLFLSQPQQFTAGRHLMVCWHRLAFKVVFCTLRPGFEFCGYECSWSVLVLFLPGCGRCLQGLCKAVLKCNSTSEEPQCFSEKSQQAMCD